MKITLPIIIAEISRSISASPNGTAKMCRKPKSTSSMAGHFGLDTAADQIAQLVRDFMK